MPGGHRRLLIRHVAQLGGDLALPQSTLGVGEQVLMKIFTKFFT